MTTRIAFSDIPASTRNCKEFMRDIDATTGGLEHAAEIVDEVYGNTGIGEHPTA